VGAKDKAFWVLIKDGSMFEKGFWFLIKARWVLEIGFSFFIKDGWVGAKEKWWTLFKLYLCIFEKSQGKHNNLDCKYILGNRFHYLQSFNVKNLMQIENPFACSKHSNL